MKKNLLCWLLALTMVLTPVLTACTKPDTDEDTVIETSSESETEGEGTNGTETETDTDPSAPASISIGGVPIEEFVVIHATDASAAELNAIDEMIDLIAKSTGHTLRQYPDTVHAAHEIVIGQTEQHDTSAVYSARLDVKADGYAMLTDGGHLFITGSSVRGTVYGIYDFLEQYLGVRFYSAFFTHVRADGRNDVPADLSKVFNPTFLIRNQYTSYYANQGAHLRESGTLGKASLYDNTIGGIHNLGPLAGAGGSGSADVQPCLTDESVYQNVLGHVLSYAAKLENGGIINVMQNDSPSYCTCENCAAIDAYEESPAGSLLTFINRLAVDVREAYPDREIYIQTFAYTYSAKPPKHLIAEDNVMIQFCAFGGCFAHAYNDPNCPSNVIVYEQLRTWSQICQKITVWDYSANDASRTAIGPNLDVLWDNMQVFKNNNVIGQFHQQHGIDTGEFSELRTYLIGHMMWNPDMTREEFETLRDEFMEDYYGNAAPYIREYLDLTTRASQTVIEPYCGGHTAIWTDGDNFFHPLDAEGKKDYTLIDKYVELWEKAETCTLTLEQRAHMEKSSLHFYAHMADYGRNPRQSAEYFQKYDALRTKYTYAESTLPEAGITDGVDPTVPSKGLVFQFNGDGTCYISDIGTFEGGLLVIPSTAPNGDRVTAIAPYAFSRCTNLVEVIIPDGITEIGEFAFRGCNNLASVTLPASVSKIGFGGFGRRGDPYGSCNALKDIYFLGTEAQWAAVDTGAYWANHMAQATVRCSDSEIA